MAITPIFDGDILPPTVGGSGLKQVDESGGRDMLRILPPTVGGSGLKPRGSGGWPGIPHSPADSRRERMKIRGIIGIRISLLDSPADSRRERIETRRSHGTGNRATFSRRQSAGAD